MGTWTERLRANPTPWLMEKACPAIRFRLLTEIEGRPADDPDVAAVRQEVYAYKPALTIAGCRSDEGIWFQSLLDFEAPNYSRKKGPGTVAQYLALVEYGWGRDHPIIWSTSELLQGLLWEDPSIDLCELNGYLGGDPAVEAWLRRRLSRIAAALLVRSGFSDDPGLRRQVKPIYAGLADFYGDGEDPQDRLYVGTTTRVKETDEGPVEERCTLFDAAAPIPEHMLMLLLAFDERRDDEEGMPGAMRGLSDYMFAHPAPEIEVTEVGGKLFEKERDLEIRSLGIGDYKERKLVGRLLLDLELLARCGVLETQPRAVELLEWLISMQDEEGVVRAEDYLEKVVHRLDYSYFPLEDNWRGKHKKFTDVTFRLLLILALLDRQASK